MKVGEFQRKISVSSVAYSRFMRQNGRDKSAASNTFAGSWRFFKKRELQGMTTPNPKKTWMAPVTKKPGSETAGGLDLSSIWLEGEEDNSVPVFAAIVGLAPATPAASSTPATVSLKSCELPKARRRARTASTWKISMVTQEWISLVEATRCVCVYGRHHTRTR